MSPIFLAVFTILLAFSDGFPSKESDMMTKFEVSHRECADLNSVSMEDVMKRKNIDPNAPVTENMMCFDKCVFEKNGLLATDGQLKIDMALQAFAPVEPQKAAMLISAMTKCNMLGERQNTCAAVNKILTCTFKTLMAKE